MKLKLSLEHTGESADIVVTVEAATSVGAVADQIEKVHPRGGLPGGVNGPLTLAVMVPERLVIDPSVSVGESGLHSGAVVSLTRDGVRYSTARGGTAVAYLRVVGGPDEGKEFPLLRGTSIIGREASCDVRLSDGLVSRQHARLHVTDIVEVVDLGSSNGVIVGGDVVARVALRTGDVVQVGDTQFTVSTPLPLRAAESTSHDGGAIPFNRSPRLDPPYVGVELASPTPPQPPKPRRFPLLTLLAPLFMAPVLYLTTHSLASLTFVALSPLMLIANVAEGRVVGKREFKAGVRDFRSELASLLDDATAAAELERTGRCLEVPSTTECLAAVRDRSPLLWTRRPAHANYLTLRIGLGSVPARNVIAPPQNAQSTRALLKELADATAPFAVANDVPVTAALRDGATGIAGERSSSLAVARAFAVQLVALHSPAEVVLGAFTSSATAADWEWLKWLPHTSSPHSPITARHLVSSPGAGAGLLSELEDLLERRTTGDHPKGADMAAPAVVLLVEDDAPVDRSRVVALAASGVRAGIHVVWLAADTSLLPAVCTTFVDARPHGGEGATGYVEDAMQVAPMRLETCSAADALAVARRLAPLVDSGVPIDDDSDLPRSVSFLTMTGREIADDPHAVVERWSESGSILTGPHARAVHERRVGTLRCVLGQSAGEPLAVDLRAHGPHALVGGTTGSGKSELLQTWILGMAAAHSPQRVTFLLVDYKGGAAFSECVDLPHTVGLVTDLSPYLVRRALTSLAAELRYREHLLAAKGAKDLLELERRGDEEAPPSLVIVVDEFAALVHEVPEFVDGVVNVAQRGRSLGLHLILATQRPAGVIKDNLRANTNLRLALRMADEADSQDVIGTPQAASFDAAIPGRAVSKTGPGRLLAFQAAYAGGWTTDEPTTPEVLIDQLTFGTATRWEPRLASAVAAADPGESDIVRLVRSLRSAAVVADIPAPRRPWLPELAVAYDLATLPSPRRDDALVFGVRDDPESQDQPTVAFHPDKDGNIAVFGTGGAGKSGLLRALAIAAGFTVRGGPCHVYGIDFGARGLQMLEPLPHVGSIIAGADHERIGRLMSWLRTLIDDRAARFASVSAGTITDYRRLSGRADEPRILVLIDGMAAFRSAYELGERSKWFDMLAGIMTDARPVGVHFIISADRPGAIPTLFGSSIQRRIVLRLADENDYLLVGAPGDVMNAQSPAGRGLFDDAEIQVAVLGGDADGSRQTEAVRLLAASMRRAGVLDAPEIQRLAEHVRLEDLPPTVDGLPTFGVSGDSLQPIGFEPSGSFLVVGPPGSGRASVLATLAMSARTQRRACRLVYFGNKRSELAGLSMWDDVALTPAEATDLANACLPKVIDNGPEECETIVVLDGVADFVGSPADFALQELVKACNANGHLVLADGETSAVMGSYPLLVAIKNSRAGIALQPDQSDGATIFRTNFPRVSRADFPLGRGLYVTRGVATVVQVAESL